MNQARRAIIVAAGIGSRMQPVTDTVPKPLVRVNGVRMIDTSIQALHQNGIREIYVVVGYRKEQFAELPKQYPGLRLIENPDYRSANNISSLYYAREYLGDTIILDGDQLLREPEILKPQFERSGYCAIYTDQPTQEWLLTLEDGMVTGCSRTGGPRGWELHSVSFWSKEDGARLRKHLELEYVEKRRRDIYWDDVALFCHPEDYQLGIRPISRESLLEIDSYEELCALDPSYRGLERKESL
jgi:CTP:phosphocholine cytidylyltransferase-like protein